MDVGTVSSGHVLESYAEQLKTAHHRIAILEAALKEARAKLAQKEIQEFSQAHEEGEVS